MPHNIESICCMKGKGRKNFFSSRDFLIFLYSIIGFNFIRNIFSNSFGIIGNNEIGLKDETSFGSFHCPFFTFHSLGIYLNLKNVLIR